MEYATIKGFEKMSKQELFDMSARHILSTGVKSTNNQREGFCLASGCKYSGPGCAAAPFLRPEMRVSLDNLGGWYSLATNHRVPKHEHEFISELQKAHDISPYGKGFMEEWEDKMNRIAAKHSLSLKVFDGAVCPALTGC